MAENFSHERILENIAAVKDGIKFGCKVSDRDARGVTLLAATKTVDPETINFAIENGITTIGENRVQELLEKYDAINKDNVDIHFIGRLQTNKVKYIIDKVSMIHSVDSFKLAAEIDRQAKKHGIVMNVLAEINIGHEDSKGGVDPAQTEEFLRGLSTFENIKVKGLMTIPPIATGSDSDDESTKNHLILPPDRPEYKKIYKNREYFKKIMKLFLDISAKKIDNIDMHELSMGMSEDYVSAVAEGATVVRIGRALFGAR